MSSITRITFLSAVVVSLFRTVTPFAPVPILTPPATSTRQHTTPLHLALPKPSTPEITRRHTLQTAAAVITTTLLPTSSTPAVAATPLPQVPTTTLGSLKISRTIQGYWQLSGGHGKYKPGEPVKNMKAYYDAGVTTLDTADIYGPSEGIVGQFVGGEKGSVPCTKFCCYRFLDEIDRAEVRRRILTSCERLKVDKLPLVQFFWSNYSIKKYVDVALMLAELKSEGLIQEIGATNFDLTRLKELKAADVPLVSHQVQLSALDRRPVQSGMTDWCAENNIKIIAFGTVASGILSDRYLGRDGPPTKEETTTASLRLYGNTVARFGSWSLVQELLKTMDAVARDVRESGRCEGATIANVAQRYVLEGRGVGAVLVGVRNRDHLEENVRTHEFELTNAEREAIDDVVKKRQGPKGDVWDIERGNAV